MISTLERRQEIVLLADKAGKVSVNELADRYGVSTVTIRQDLNELSRKGLIVRSRGGAIPSNRLSKELSIKEKHSENHKIKQILGKAVADLIEDGESIIIDSGTTTEEVAQNLFSKEDLVVMTNGLNIANELARIPDCTVYMIGGRLRRKSMSLHDSLAEDKLKLFNFNKVILGVDSIDIKGGLSTHYQPEAKLNRIMCDCASQTLVVTDSSKFGRKSLHSIIPLEEVDVLVTDDGIPDEYKDHLLNLDIDLHIVSVT